ncbi:hypothetical protein D3C71_1557230 [compost metagenome]
MSLLEVHRKNQHRRQNNHHTDKDHEYPYSKHRELEGTQINHRLLHGHLADGEQNKCYYAYCNRNNYFRTAPAALFTGAAETIHDAAEAKRGKHDGKRINLRLGDLGYVLHKQDSADQCNDQERQRQPENPVPA